MNFTAEKQTQYYIVQALFDLLDDCEFSRITVSEVVKKAGVGRATFYRYFKRKEDIIIYFFQTITREFVFNQKLFPKSKEDYIVIVENAFTTFKENMKDFKVLKKANLQSLFLDYLNKFFERIFCDDFDPESKYKSYLYAGMLFNVMMAWLDDDCCGSVQSLAILIADSLNLK